MNRMVLVCEASVLDRVGRFQGYSLKVDDYIPALFHPAATRFMARDLAEHDPQFKQLIPYVVLRYRDSLFQYVRGKGASESRLLAKRSVGLGGHIEPIDQSLFASQWDLYLEAAKREVHEEVHVNTTWKEHIVGILNDDSSEVGQVHLGIVHLWDVLAPAVRKREGQITQAGFVPIHHLKRKPDVLETWSQFVLHMLEDACVPPYSDVGEGIMSEVEASTVERGPEG